MSHKKFVAALNKKIEPGKVMNALAHMTAGLLGTVSDPVRQEMEIINYADQNGSAHMASKHPFIILKAENSNKLRTFRQECVARNIPFASFTSAMTVGGWEAQVELSKTTPEVEMEYYGVVAFGNPVELNELTRKFSLWV